MRARSRSIFQFRRTEKLPFDGLEVCGNLILFCGQDIHRFNDAITEKQAKKEQIERFLAELERQDGVATEFDEEQWYSLVDFVTVFNKEDIRFTFKDGTEIRT